MPAGPPLIEREHELGLLDGAITAALAGEGGLIVVEGPAGIGKTALLREARRRASDRGFEVVSAQGSLLEADFGFGVAQQLFEATVARIPARERRELLAGAAELAIGVVAPGSHPNDASPLDSPAILHACTG